MSTPSFCHWYEVPPVTVNVCEPPGQMLAVAGLMEPEGAELVVITELLDAGPEQLPLKMVAVYVPAAVALCVADVAPVMSTPSFCHWYDVPPVAVSVNEPPVQIDPLDGLIVPEGAELVVITELLDAGPEQLPLKIVAVYEPAVVALYVADVAPAMSTPSFFH